jgi:hypothetical protein
MIDQRLAYGPPPAGFHGGPAWVPRTRLTGIVVSWAVFVVLGLVALSGFLGTVAAGVNEAKPAVTFAGGQVIDVTLDPGDRPAIYVAAQSPSRVGCAISRGGRLTSVQDGPTVRDHGTEWQLAFRVTVPEPGAYQVRCTGEGVTFGVGKELAGGDLVVWTVLLIVLPALGFIGAVVTTAIVIGKRRADRFEAHAALYR